MTESIGAHLGMPLSPAHLGGFVERLPRSLRRPACGNELSKPRWAGMGIHYRDCQF